MRKLSDLQIKILKQAWFFCEDNPETDIFIADIVIMIDPRLEAFAKQIYTYTITHNEEKIVARSVVKDWDDCHQTFFENCNNKVVKQLFNKARVIAHKSLKGLEKRELISMCRVNPIKDEMSHMTHPLVGVIHAHSFLEMMESKKDGEKYRSFTSIKLTRKGLEYCKDFFGFMSFKEEKYQRLLDDIFREV